MVKIALKRNIISYQHFLNYYPLFFAEDILLRPRISANKLKEIKEIKQISSSSNFPYVTPNALIFRR